MNELGRVLLIVNFIAHVIDKLWEYELFEIRFGNFLNLIFSLSSSPKLSFVSGEEWALNVLSNQRNENSRTRNYTFKSRLILMSRYSFRCLHISVKGCLLLVRWVGFQSTWISMFFCKLSTKSNIFNPYFVYVASDLLIRPIC